MLVYCKLIKSYLSSWILNLLNQISLIFILALFSIFGISKQANATYFNFYLGDIYYNIVLDTIEKSSNDWKKSEQIQSNFSFRWLTFIGGSNADGLISIAKNGDNCFYVAGSIKSNDFPFPSIGKNYKLESDIIILKISYDEQIIWGTVLGSRDNDYIFFIACDSSGNIWAAAKVVERISH